MKNENTNTTELSEALKAAMKERSYSLREFSAVSGICASSLSRILNNKQNATLEHLRIFSKHLRIPMERLLLAASGGANAGSLEGGRVKTREASYFMLNLIEEILNYFNMDLQDIMSDIEKELSKYEQYAKTQEGKNKILNEFERKLNDVNGSGLIIDRLDLLYRKFLDKDTDPKKLPLIGSALLYFILSADIIPDYIFPIGYLDDAIAVRLIMDKIAEKNKAP